MSVCIQTNISMSCVRRSRLGMGGSRFSIGAATEGRDGDATRQRYLRVDGGGGLCLTGNKRADRRQELTDRLETMGTEQVHHRQSLPNRAGFAAV